MNRKSIIKQIINQANQNIMCFITEEAHEQETTLSYIAKGKMFDLFLNYKDYFRVPLKHYFPKLEQAWKSKNKDEFYSIFSKIEEKFEGMVNFKKTFEKILAYDNLKPHSLKGELDHLWKHISPYISRCESLVRAIKGGESVGISSKSYDYFGQKYDDIHTWMIEFHSCVKVMWRAIEIYLRSKQSFADKDTYMDE